MEIEFARDMLLISNKLHAKQQVLTAVLHELLTSLPPGQSAAIVARARHRWSTQRQAHGAEQHPDADAEGLALLVALESAVRGGEST